LLIAAAFFAGTLGAHEGEPPSDIPRTGSWAWEFDPGSILLLAITGMAYTRGLIRLWHRIGWGHGIRWIQALCFASGWLATVFALVSPLHRWGNTLFSAHMVQHEVLMLIAAPLLILGRPLPVMLWALPRRWSRAGVEFLKGRRIAGAWPVLMSPPVAWILHALAVWVWHLPALFQVTLSSGFVHALQHSSFLGTALLFWLSLFQGSQRQVGNGAAVMYLFTTALHTGALGALLTFASAPWYPAYAATAGAWGFTALEDQQLGGLIMWIPGSVVYICTGLFLFAAWLRESETRVGIPEIREDFGKG
jgi:putative membrane protein